jgi:hypothetical protein
MTKIRITEKQYEVILSYKSLLKEVMMRLKLI